MNKGGENMKEGWKMVKLGEICETSAGGTPSKMHKEYYEGGKIPWMLSGEVCQKYIYEVEHYITSEGLENSSAKIFPINSVVVAMYGATAGQVGILKIESSTNQAVCGILPNDKMFPEFLYYYFLYYKDILVAQAVGNAQPNISQQKIKAVEIPLLSLEEQHRIVSILDAAFAKIDALKKNAEENLANAKALFQQVLAQELKPKEGWVEKKLTDISENLDYKRIPITKNVRKSGKFPYYGASGIVDYVNDYLYDEDLLLISEDGANLLARTTPIAFSVSGKIWVNNHAHVLRFNNLTLQKFVEYFIAGFNITPYVTGMAQPKLNQKALEKIIISFPTDIEEQHRIVSTLDTLSEKCRRLEEVAQQTIRECDALKQSILRKAFSGEL